MHPENAALYAMIDRYEEALKAIRDKLTDDPSWRARLALHGVKEVIEEAADGKKKA